MYRIFNIKIVSKDYKGVYVTSTVSKIVHISDHYFHIRLNFWQLEELRDTLSITYLSIFIRFQDL